MRNRAHSSDGVLNVSWCDTVNKDAGERENLPPLEAAAASASEGGAGADSSSAALYTTEIVRAMFGKSVGMVEGDYACYYKRTSGRLYAATTSLCFYSNLFGSETKHIFRLGEVTEVTRTKSSGLSITTANGTVHAFKGFQQRDRAFQTILRLQLKESPAGVGGGTAADPSETRNDRSTSSSSLLATTRPAETTAADSESNPRNALDRRFRSFSTLSEIPMSASRRRSSLKMVIKPKGPKRNNGKKHKRTRSKSVDALLSRAATDASEESTSESSSDVDVASEEDEAPPGPAADDLKSAWLAQKDPPNGETLKEVALKGFHLSCDLDAFQATFLADGAPHSIHRFRKSIGDFDLETSEWKKGAGGGGEDVNGDEPGVVESGRSIRFRHPLKQRLGPSSAGMEQRQVCRRYGEHGLLVTSRIYGKGFPAADCFHVQDQWLIESAPASGGGGGGGGGVTISVGFQVNYTKATLFKKIIDSTTVKEYMEMYTRYAKMAASALGDKVEEDLAEATEEVSVEAATEAPTAAARFGWAELGSPNKGLVLAMIITLIIVIFQHMALRGRVAYLEAELEQMKDALASFGGTLTI